MFNYYDGRNNYNINLPQVYYNNIIILYMSTKCVINLQDNSLLCTPDSGGASYKAGESISTGAMNGNQVCITSIRNNDGRGNNQVWCNDNINTAVNQQGWYQSSAAWPIRNMAYTAENGFCALLSDGISIKCAQGISSANSKVPWNDVTTNVVIPNATTLGTGATNPVTVTGLPVNYNETRACANEGGKCTVSAPTLVFYGKNGRYTSKIQNGTFDCSNGVFGDPYSGVGKSCYLPTPYNYVKVRGACRISQANPPVSWVRHNGYDSCNALCSADPTCKGYDRNEPKDGELPSNHGAECYTHHPIEELSLNSNLHPEISKCYIKKFPTAPVTKAMSISVATAHARTPTTDLLIRTPVPGETEVVIPT